MGSACGIRPWSLLVVGLVVLSGCAPPASLPFDLLLPVDGPVVADGAGPGLDGVPADERQAFDGIRADGSGDLAPIDGSGGGDDDGGPGDDQGPADLPPPDYPPSPANLGWIGGACEQDSDCQNPEARCLRVDGFPNGMCSSECQGSCADRGEPGDTVSFCADGRPYDLEDPLTNGFCVARCDVDVLPGSGCPAGYRCVPRNRYGQPATVVEVCVPLATRTGGCTAGGDELIAVPYPDRGMVWIPAEAQCGGDFDVVVLLHGINPQSNPTPSLGGGRHLEVLVRSLIDQGLMRPVILAEPVHFEPGSTTLYGAGFDLTTHLDLVNAELGPRGITTRTLSYTGHSGAGCDPDNGLYKVLAEMETLVPEYAPALRLWGLEDICYESDYHFEAPIQALASTGTVILNMYSVQGDPDAFEAGLLPDPQPLACDDSLYSSCLAHASKPWCSYRTRAAAGIGHDNNPYFFTREAFPQVFSDEGVPCRAP